MDLKKIRGISRTSADFFVWGVMPSLRGMTDRQILECVEELVLTALLAARAAEEEIITLEYAHAAAG